MSEGYVPSQDSLALAWMQAFASGISADVAKYQLSSADAANIQSVVDAFADLFAQATTPTTRTPVIVAGKSQARAVAEQVCRQFAMQIKLNAGISDADKIAIGVRPPNPNRDPINVPSTSPILAVLGATPGSHTLRYMDSSTPDSAAKPFGAAQIQLFVAVSAEPTTDETDAVFYGTFTKNPIGVSFSNDEDGKVATYFARWASRKGETGPWSLPVSMRIAA